MNLQTLNIHGLAITCEGSCPELMTQLLRPFHYFLLNGKLNARAATRIMIKEEGPPYETFPTMAARFSTPRNIVYSSRDIKIIDYFGAGVVVERPSDHCFTIYSPDRNFLQEAFYLIVISLLGQHVDRSGLLRIHALALCYKDIAFLLPIPPGGGKSTMAISLLQEEGIKLISDDEPIFDKTGAIHPFHTRIGTLDKSIITTIPQEFYYEIDRMEFGRKFFIDCAFWEDKLQMSPVKRTILFVSQRVLNGEPEITRAPKLSALRVLVRDAVVGVGLYQGLEFIFKSTPWEIFAKLLIIVRRFRLAVKLTRQSQTYSMTLGGDVRRNAKVLAEFMRTIS